MKPTAFRRYGTYLAYYVGSLLGKRKPLLGGIKLTHDCNLSCVHCPFWRRRGPSLSFEQAVSSLDALRAAGVRLVILEGGEPFLWRSGSYTLEDVIREAGKRFFTVGVTTNGTFPLETQADVLWVSIDGLKATHDRIRGASFDRILAHVEASSHPRLYAHITINALNRQEIPELVEFLAPKVKGITIQFHYPYDEIDDALCLAPGDREAVLDALLRLKREGLPLADSAACLRALKRNRWTCRPWMIASVDPDGTMTHGCYVKERGRIACEQCGFAAHTELSLAYGWGPGAILAGARIFG